MQSSRSIFEDTNIRSSLTPFTESHLDHVETSFFGKAAKPTLTYPTSGKNKIAIANSEVAALAYLETIREHRST